MEKIILAFQKEGYLSGSDDKSISINEMELDGLINYLESKLKNSEIWLLSRSSLRFLSEFMDQINKQNKDYTDDTLITDIFDLNTIG